MFHVKLGRKSMKMERGTDILLVKKFRYRKMQTLDLLLVSNYEDFYGKLNLQYLDNHLKGTSQSQIRMRFVISG